MISEFSEISEISDALFAPPSLPLRPPLRPLLAPSKKAPAEKTPQKKSAISWRYCKNCVALHSQQQAAAVGGLLPPPERRGATFGKLSSTEFWQIYVTLIICKDVHAIGIAFCTETKEQKKISSGVDFTCYTLQVLPEPQLSNGLSIHATLFNPRNLAEHFPSKPHQPFPQWVGTLYNQTDLKPP